jgi:hypothetical protein
MENTNNYTYEEDCVICSENKISRNLHCYKCNKYICVTCCNKLSSRTSLLFVEQKQIFIKYQCPFCRYTNNKHIRLFNKNEIISIYYDNLSQLSFSHKYNIALANMYRDLDNENKILIEELNSKNEYIKELEERLLVNTR